MQALTTDLIGQACRIFLTLAYPGGETAIPAAKRQLLVLPPALAMFNHLDSEPTLLNVCQVVTAKTGGPVGQAFQPDSQAGKPDLRATPKAGGVRALLIRLGCGHYPNLKLKVQLIDGDPKSEWLFSVDTHDAYSSTTFLPPPDHPDAAAWRSIQVANVALKEKIEAAWEEAGLLTFNGLLRRDLQIARPSNS